MIVTSLPLSCVWVGVWAVTLALRGASDDSIGVDVPDTCNVVE